MSNRIKIPESYHDRMYRLYGQPDNMLSACRYVTFVVTEDCCLNCTYCYETNKSKKRMSLETGKRIVDYLFELYEQDDKELLINKNTKSIILDFIGGEPLLESKLIYNICDYFWHKALELRHPWADNFRISITSNGVLYFEPDFQKFLRKFGRRLSMTITLDGDREMHDKCRVHPDGSGSWDEAYKAEKDILYRTGNTEPGTKVTIAPENLPHLYHTFEFFIREGYREINANLIYEHAWTVEEANLYYNQLIQIADLLLGLDYPVYTSLFVSSFFQPIPETENQTWCGGSGGMLSFDTEGLAYPCLRYMEMSLNGEQKPLIIGDCYRGIYQDKCEKKLLQELKSVNRRTQNTDECYYCPIAAGCASCTAWDYQSSGSLFKRSTNICWMHRARSLANVYYWNKYYRKNGIHERMKMYLPKDDALQIVPESVYNELESLAE